MRRPEIGDIVYESFSPQRCGKVIDEKLTTYQPPYGPPEQHRHVLVRWAVKGNPETWEAGGWYGMKHLDDLIAETEKKLKNHKARLAKAQAL